jgi:hypothetical protein
VSSESRKPEPLREWQKGELVRLPLETALIRIANEPLDAETMADIAQRALTGSPCGVPKPPKEEPK